MWVFVMQLRTRAEEIARAPWAFSSADISAVILELLQQERSPTMDYQSALQVAQQPQLYDADDVAKALDVLNTTTLPPYSAAQELGLRRVLRAAIWLLVVVIVCTVVLALVY